LVAIRTTEAQFPFPTISPEGEDVRDLPESVPTDLIEPRIAPRETAADKLARIFNRELRDIEERQKEIMTELNKLPETAIESFLPRAFGYHSGSNRSRPKWIQIDLGETVTPDSIALFPVTVQVKGETIFGYGFPRAFRIDISDDSEFKSYETMFEGRVDVVDGSRRWPFFKEIGGYEGRYIRVSATGLWRPKDERGREAFALSEIMVFKGERNLAVGRSVKSRDTQEKGDRWSRRFVNDGVTAFGIPQGKEESPTFGFRSKSRASTTKSWVQIDLEESMPIEEIRIILTDIIGGIPDPTVRFPYPITIQTSENPDMTRADTLGKFTPQQVAQIGNNPLILPVNDGYGRYVRLTVAQSRAANMDFSLAEVQIFSENRNVALWKPVLGSHPLIMEGVAPAYLVDGFSSRKKLVGYQSWVSNLEQRIQLVREWRTIENDRLDLVDRTFTRGVASSITGLLGGLALALVIFAQGKVKRRKDLEYLRQRIASDLHDDIGSNLSSIALLAELGKTETGEPTLVSEEFDEIKTTADKTIESMRDIVWLIRPGEETWKQMMTRFRETASKLLRAHEYSFIETGQMHDDRLPLEFKRDFFLIYKEVLNNIVRHADADNVFIEVETTRGKLDLRIQDDGRGFDNLDKNFREGNGLRNLRMRAQAIGAKLKVKSSVNHGTMVQLTAPLP
jgi:signal transduction histidine kinase